MTPKLEREDGIPMQDCKCWTTDFISDVQDHTMIRNEMLIKTTMRYQLSRIGSAKMRKQFRILVRREGDSSVEYERCHFFEG